MTREDDVEIRVDEKMTTGNWLADRYIVKAKNMLEAEVEVSELITKRRKPDYEVIQYESEMVNKEGEHVVVWEHVKTGEGYEDRYKTTVLINGEVV